jgi:hypothetical protein
MSFLTVKKCRLIIWYSNINLSALDIADVRQLLCWNTLVCTSASSVCPCGVGLFQCHFHIYQMYVCSVSLYWCALHISYWLWHAWFVWGLTPQRHVNNSTRATDRMRFALKACIEIKVIKIWISDYDVWEGGICSKSAQCRIIIGNATTYPILFPTCVLYFVFNDAVTVIRIEKYWHVVR